MTDLTRRACRDLLIRARAALETPDDVDEMARASLIEDLAVAVTMAVSDQVLVEVAVIDSGDGIRCFVAMSDAALIRELAAWCRPRWDRTGDPRDHAALGDDDIVRAYFAGGISEYFAIGSARIASHAPGPEQGRYCVLSTAHLSHATSEWLERWSLGPPPPPPVAIATTFHGWFVSTREPEMPAEPLPPDLLAAMRFGWAWGFDHLLFDSDAGRIEGLDVHDW